MGSWKLDGKTGWYLYICSDGSLIYNFRGGGNQDIAVGKIANTFDSYPYTIKLTGANNYGDNKHYSGTVTFNSTTNLNYYFEYGVYKDTSTFSKIDNKEYTIKDVCPWYWQQLSSK